MLSITRLFRLGVRLTEWATPLVKEWHRQRHFNRREGHRHLESRNWTEAEKHLALALAERRHSVKRRIELLLGLEKAQRRQRKLAEAEETARTAIDLAARDHSLRSRALDALVDVHLDQEKYAEAEKTIGEITSLEGARPNPDHARLAQCSRKLGTALLNSARNTEAKEAFQRAAALSEQAFGADHVETANILAELGMLCRQHGDHAEAQRCLRRALQVHRTVSGPASQEATQDLYHLAASLEESGDLNGAVDEYERMLSLSERQVGGNREDKADAQVHLAALYLQAGRSSAARELLTMAIGVLQRKGGQRLALAFATMACAEDQAGRTEDANRWREKAANMGADLVQ